MIDPDLQRILAGMAEQGFALPEPMTAPAMRAVMDWPIPGPEIEIAEVRSVSFAAVGRTIGARLYHPEPGAVLPAVVLIHGGGWVLGTLDTHDRLARVLARESGCAVLSVDYRLAPEHPFPAGFEDCLTVVRALSGKAQELGVHPSGYGLVGDSAGANLAAAVAAALAGQAGAPAAQVLFYPVIDRRFDTASYLAAPPQGLLTAAMMQWFWEQYLPGGAEPDARAAPIRAPDLEGVAPAILILAGNDPLHDEGVAYAARLEAAGAPVEVHDFAEAVHGFASFVGLAPIADRAVRLASQALRRRLSNP